MKDLFLVDWVEIANSGTPVDIILLIHGQLYCGTLVSFDDYCNAKCDNGTSVYNFSDEPDDDKAVCEANYLHLKNITILPNQKLNVGVPLRIKIKDVSGFTLGCLDN